MSKWEDFKNNVRFKVNNTWRWMCDNPIIAGAIISAIGGTTVAGCRAVKAHYDNQKRLKQVYDPQMGYYLELKRPLRTTEKVELAKRHLEGGENITSILDDMGRLK